MCKSRRASKMLSNACLLSKIGFDSAENEPAENLLFLPILLARRRWRSRGTGASRPSRSPQSVRAVGKSEKSDQDAWPKNAEPKMLREPACLSAANLVDLKKMLQNDFLVAKIGFDTAAPLRYLQFLRIVRFTSQPASQPRTSPPKV